MNNSYEDCEIDEAVIDLMRIINKEFTFKTTFVVGNIDKDTLANLGRRDSNTKYINLINSLQAEGIDVITIDHLFGTNELKHTKVIIVSTVIIESQLRTIIQVLQNCRKNEKLCIACISDIIDHDTLFANNLLDQFRERARAQNAIHNFHQAFTDKSVDNIKKYYASAVEIIETNKNLSYLLPALKIIKDKYSEFERDYSEGIVAIENVTSVNFSIPIEYQYIDTSIYYYVVFLI